MMSHICAGLFDEEICDEGEVWAPCDADICNDPCQRVGLCKCPCHEEV